MNEIEVSVESTPLKKARAKPARKFKSYNSLITALRRGGIKNPGTTATLFLELFIENHGKLFAAQVSEYSLCQPGRFKEWRDDLVKKGWIAFDYREAQVRGDWERHSPGAKLLPFINKEKLARHELATRDELDILATKEELHEATEGTLKALNVLSDSTAKVEHVEAMQAEMAMLKQKVAVLETRQDATESTMRKIYHEKKLGELDPPGYEKLQEHVTIEERMKNMISKVH
jgi:hypothetical protein